MNRRAFENGRDDALAGLPMNPAPETSRPIPDRKLRAYARAYRAGYRQTISEMHARDAA